MSFIGFKNESSLAFLRFELLFQPQVPYKGIPYEKTWTIIVITVAL